MKDPASIEQTREDWWREWFNSLYMDVYSHRDEDEAEQEVRATLSVLPLKPDRRILDLCCGNGRHTRALYRLGYTHISALDYSFPLLRHAKSSQPAGKFTRGNMRILPFRDASHDGVLSYFTSFGYFKTNIENLQVLQEISRVLKPGGSFLLDYLNPAYVREKFVPESAKEHGNYRIEERRWFSKDGERVEKAITIKNWGGEDRTYYESVRLYSLDEMESMLQDADLTTKGVLGAFNGEPFSERSPRMVLFGYKQ